jgi:hypothetical protein
MFRQEQNVIPQSQQIILIATPAQDIRDPQENIRHVEWIMDIQWFVMVDLLE